MKIIEFITTRIESYKHKRLINRLRGHLRFFGHDLSQIPDEELELLVSEASEKLSMASRKSGLTAKELQTGFMTLSKSINRSVADHKET